MPTNIDKARPWSIHMLQIIFKLILLQIDYLLPFSEKVDRFALCDHFVGLAPNSRKTALATTVQVARIRRQLPADWRVRHVRLNISLCCTSFYAMLVKRIKLVLRLRKLRDLSSFRFEALRKVQVYLLVSAGKIFQLFEAKGKFWKIKMIAPAFSQRTSAGRFGATFSTKGGSKERKLFNLNFDFYSKFIEAYIDKARPWSLFKAKKITWRFLCKTLTIWD